MLSLKHPALKRRNSKIVENIGRWEGLCEEHYLSSGCRSIQDSSETVAFSQADGGVWSGEHVLPRSGRSEMVCFLLIPSSHCSSVVA